MVFLKVLLMIWESIWELRILWCMLKVKVLLDRENKEVLAIGAEAKQMIGRTPGHIVAIRPMKDGVIADFDITQSMLKYFIKKAIGKHSLVRPRIVVGVPSGVTEVEKRAVIDATVQAGAREAYLIEEPMAAAK